MWGTWWRAVDGWTSPAVVVTRQSPDHAGLVAAEYCNVGTFTDQPAIARLLDVRASQRCHHQHRYNDLATNHLEFRGNNSAAWNNMKLVHWPLMGGLLNLVQRRGDWVGPQPAQAPPRCTKCNSPPINGQCTNHHIAVTFLLGALRHVGITRLSTACSTRLSSHRHQSASPTPSQI